MRLAYCPFIDLLSSDIPVIVDLSVEWEDGTPHIIVNNIYESGGKVSLLFNEDKLMRDIGYRLADMAENCPGLLFRAVEQDTDERMVA